MPEPEREERNREPVIAPARRRVAIGCFTAWIGFLSFGMIGALVSRFVAFVTRAATCPDVPACNWHVYVGVGGLVGAISLPWLVVRAMGKPKQT